MRMTKYLMETDSCTLRDPLLVDPRVRVGLPPAHTLREPQGDLLLGRLDGVRSVADVASDVNAKVTTNGARGRISGVGGTKHDTAGLNGIEAFPHHAAHGAGEHVLNQSREELLAAEVSIVLLEELLRRAHQLHGLKLEALGLEASDDVADKAALDAVRLNHDVSSLHSESTHIYI
jgi:hypothetical protein